MCTTSELGRWSVIERPRALAACCRRSRRSPCMFSTRRAASCSAPLQHRPGAADGQAAGGGGGAGCAAAKRQLAGGAGARGLPALARASFPIAPAWLPITAAPSCRAPRLLCSPCLITPMESLVARWGPSACGWAGAGGRARRHGVPAALLTPACFRLSPPYPLCCRRHPALHAPWPCPVLWRSQRHRGATATWYRCGCPQALVASTSVAARSSVGSEAGPAVARVSCVCPPGRITLRPALTRTATPPLQRRMSCLPLHTGKHGVAGWLAGGVLQGGWCHVRRRTTSACPAIAAPAPRSPALHDCCSFYNEDTGQLLPALLNPTVAVGRQG